MYPIDFFWRAARRWPERTAIDAPEGAITYAALAAQVRAVSRALLALDPEPGSRVGLCAHNSAAHIAVLLAVLACGKVWVPLNPKSTRPEIRRIVDAKAPPCWTVPRGCSCPARAMRWQTSRRLTRRRHNLRSTCPPAPRRPSSSPAAPRACPRA
jgi:acyl-CoA synthetase (AMP-forming)/AMP-acid ligase II